MDVADESKEKRLSMDEILRNLLSCSEEESPLEKAIHVYDPRELQSGWQWSSSNVKYVACPEKRERASPSVTSDSSSRCSNIKQKRLTNKEKSKDFRRGNFPEKFNKYESLGVLSYGVPSWRTIVDPETCTYLKRSHPCCFNEAPHKTNEINQGITSPDPGTALDQHLGSFIKRQRANKILQTSIDENISTAIGGDQDQALGYEAQSLAQSICELTNEGIVPPIRQKKGRQHSDIQTALFPRPNIIALTTPAKHPKAGIHNSCIPLTRRLSPLPARNRVVGCERKYPTQIQQFQQFPPFKKSSSPVSFQIVKPINKQSREQKLNWLPITSTPTCIPGNMLVESSENADLEWPKTAGVMSNNPINQAIEHLKSQIPIKEKEEMSLGHTVPCKVVELPLGFGLNWSTAKTS